MENKIKSDKDLEKEIEAEAKYFRIYLVALIIILGIAIYIGEFLLK